MYPLLNSVYISFYFLVCVYVMGMCSYAHKHEGAKALRTCPELVSSILVFETRSLPGSSLVQLECWTNELQPSTYLHPSLFPGLDFLPIFIPPLSQDWTYRSMLPHVALMSVLEIQTQVPMLCSKHLISPLNVSNASFLS